MPSVSSAPPLPRTAKRTTMPGLRAGVERQSPPPRRAWARPRPCRTPPWDRRRQPSSSPVAGRASPSRRPRRSPRRSSCRALAGSCLATIDLDNLEDSGHLRGLVGREIEEVRAAAHRAAVGADQRSHAGVAARVPAEPLVAHGELASADVVDVGLGVGQRGRCRQAGRDGDGDGESAGATHALGTPRAG